MPNQLNFGQPITDMTGERLFRPQIIDQNSAVVGEKTNIFGTTLSDNVELWFYNPDGSFAGSVRLDPNSNALDLTTVLDNSGAIEFINVNLEKAAELAQIQPGRYTVSAYFLRDEVGSLNGQRLTIQEISPSRTEVRLYPIDLADTPDQIFEFVVPSVPRLFAKALLDQMFSQNLNASPSDTVNILNVSKVMNDVSEKITEEISRASGLSSYQNLFNTISQRTYLKAVGYLKDDFQNANVQNIEFDKYISDALDQVIFEMQQAKEIDPRFQLI